MSILQRGRSGRVSLVEQRGALRNQAALDSRLSRILDLTNIPAMQGRSDTQVLDPDDRIVTNFPSQHTDQLRHFAHYFPQNNAQRVIQQLQEESSRTRRDAKYHLFVRYVTTKKTLQARQYPARQSVRQFGTSSQSSILKRRKGEIFDNFSQVQQKLQLLANLAPRGSQPFNSQRGSMIRSSKEILVKSQE